ncbi:hypothetical protein CRUP_027045 [Coryphaenoides rupestris]|nr:hypothetical protein CRUP_027045 [Coryphaenoides rupestris]
MVAGRQEWEVVEEGGRGGNTHERRQPQGGRHFNGKAIEPVFETLAVGVDAQGDSACGSTPHQTGSEKPLASMAARWAQRTMPTSRQDFWEFGSYLRVFRTMSSSVMP